MQRGKEPIAVGDFVSQKTPFLRRRTQDETIRFVVGTVRFVIWPSPAATPIGFEPQKASNELQQSKLAAKKLAPGSRVNQRHKAHPRSSLIQPLWLPGLQQRRCFGRVEEANCAAPEGTPGCCMRSRPCRHYPPKPGSSAAGRSRCWARQS